MQLDGSRGAGSPRRRRRHPPHRRDPDLHGASPWPQPTPSTGGSWGGYVELVNAPYTSVQASWTLPALSGSTASEASFWVGLDGWGGYNGGWTVEQAGFDCVNNGGTYSYFAWSEYFPEDSRWWSTTAYPVSGGDSVSARVNFDGAHFNCTLSDVTQGWSYTEVRGLAAAQIEEYSAASSSNQLPAYPLAAPIVRGSAEIIMEATGNTLSDFGTVNFTGVSATPALTSPVQVIASLSGTNNISLTALSGGAFSMTWLSGT